MSVLNLIMRTLRRLRGDAISDCHPRLVAKHPPLFLAWIYLLKIIFKRFSNDFRVILEDNFSCYSRLFESYSKSRPKNLVVRVSSRVIQKVSVDPKNRADNL